MSDKEGYNADELKNPEKELINDAFANSKPKQKIAPEVLDEIDSEIDFTSCV